MKKIKNHIFKKKKKRNIKCILQQWLKTIYQIQL